MTVTLTRESIIVDNPAENDELISFDKLAQRAADEFGYKVLQEELVEKRRQVESGLPLKKLW